VLPKSDKQLEKIFRSRIPAMLKNKGRIVDDLIQKLMNWHHTGFSVYSESRITIDDKAGQEAMAHHIMRIALKIF